LFPFLLLSVPPSLEQGIEDVDQEGDLTEMLCEKLPHLLSALPPPVEEHGALERTFTAFRDQVGQDQPRHERPRLSEHSA
jgi:hypothetical protein